MTGPCGHLLSLANAASFSGNDTIISHFVYPLAVCEMCASIFDFIFINFAILTMLVCFCAMNIVDEIEHVWAAIIANWRCNSGALAYIITRYTALSSLIAALVIAPGQIAPLLGSDLGQGGGQFGLAGGFIGGTQNLRINLAGGTLWIFTSRLILPSPAQFYVGTITFVSASILIQLRTYAAARKPRALLVVFTSLDILGVVALVGMVIKETQLANIVNSSSTEKISDFLTPFDQFYTNGAGGFDGGGGLYAYDPYLWMALVPIEFVTLLANVCIIGVAYHQGRKTGCFPSPLLKTVVRDNVSYVSAMLILYATGIVLTWYGDELELDFHQILNQHFIISVVVSGSFSPWMYMHLKQVLAEPKKMAVGSFTPFHAASPTTTGMRSPEPGVCCSE